MAGSSEVWHPPVLLKLIQSLHDGMKAEITVDGATTPLIEVNNGLRQGCTIAPSLFNLYFSPVVEEWRRKCQPFRVDVLYKCGGKLVGDRTRRPSMMTVTELQFADDAAVVTQLVCGVCKRSFRRRQDIARHKCQTTRLRGSVQ